MADTPLGRLVVAERDARHRWQQLQQHLFATEQVIQTYASGLNIHTQERSFADAHAVTTQRDTLAYCRRIMVTVASELEIVRQIMHTDETAQGTHPGPVLGILHQTIRNVDSTMSEMERQNNNIWATWQFVLLRDDNHGVRAPSFAFRDITNQQRGSGRG